MCKPTNKPRRPEDRNCAKCPIRYCPVPVYARNRLVTPTGRHAKMWGAGLPGGNSVCGGDLLLLLSLSLSPADHPRHRENNRGPLKAVLALCLASTGWHRAKGQEQKGSKELRSCATANYPVLITSTAASSRKVLSATLLTFHSKILTESPA